MGKWIRGFPPNKKGCYLVRKSSKLYPLKYYYSRYEYDLEKDCWMKYGFLQFSGTIVNPDANILFEWWDEFSITEEKKKLKLKF